MLRSFASFGHAMLAVLVLAAVDTQLYAAEAASPEDRMTEDTLPEGEVTPVQDAATDEQADSDEYAGLSPRGRYNLGVIRLTDGAADASAEAFLSARDNAGPDPELRYRAAFNLGLALAGRADGQMDDPAQAIETLRESAAWFNDAIRLSEPGDDDGRVNLEIVLRRIQQMADQLNDQRGLETRLERIIDDQRGVRDEVRRLLAGIDAENAGSEPIGFQRQFDALAGRERVLLAEASSIADLAAEERQNIDNLGADSLTDEQRIRAFQLQNLGRFLDHARQSLSDSRRRLRRLEGERAHRGADRALAELKRAREQLDNPITVLKAVARDQLSVLEHTAAMTLIGSGRIALESEPDTEVKAPPWLTAEHLTERQDNAVMRTDETRLRLEAGTQGPATAVDDPAASRVRESATEAIPLLENALDAMRSAIEALPAARWSTAAEQQGMALDALNRALERFAGLRDLIELAYADQSGMVTVLTPDEEPSSERPDVGEMTAWLGKSVTDNLERMDRLEPLLREELLSPASDEQAGADQDDSARKEQQYEVAEALRGQVTTALRAMERSLGSGSGPVLDEAVRGLESLEELRRLFFSVVEHLRELLAEQTRTYDDTASTVTASIEELPAQLGLVAERQAAHADMSDALAAALASQADAAAATADDAAGNASQAPASDVDLSKVVEEIRGASGLMHAASVAVSGAVQSAHRMSPVLEPILNDQQGAMEHIEAAIALMQPPGEQSGDSQSGNDQQQQQQEQQQQQAKQDQEEMTQRQALRRLQAIRDRDAQRQRDRQADGTRDPVEKDW
jgi:hypothetical protein